MKTFYGANHTPTSIISIGVDGVFYMRFCLLIVRNGGCDDFVTAQNLNTTTQCVSQTGQLYHIYHILGGDTPNFLSSYHTINSE